MSSTSTTVPRRRRRWPWGGARRATADAQPASSASSDTVLAAHGVSLTFGIGQFVVHALDDVDLEIRRGTFTAILGSAGAGKTTLLDVLSGLRRPTAGCVLLDGVDVAGPGGPAGAGAPVTGELARDMSAFVFQGFNLEPTLSARENILLPASRHGRSVPEQRLDEVVRAAGLADRLTYPPTSLSRSQQQRVAIARALADPLAIFFADEPAGGLEASDADDVLRLMRRATSDFGLTVLMVTADPGAAAWADRVLILAQGRIVSDVQTPAIPQAPTTTAPVSTPVVAPESPPVEIPTSAPTTAPVPVPVVTPAPAAAPVPTRLPRPAAMPVRTTRTQEIAQLAVERLHAADRAAARTASTHDALRDELGSGSIAGPGAPGATSQELPADSARLLDEARRILEDLPGPVMPDDHDDS